MILKISGLYLEYVRFYGNLNVGKSDFLDFSPETNFLNFFCNKIDIHVENFLLKIFTKIFLPPPHNHEEIIW